MDRLRWGILGAANIARLRIIPALRASSRCELVAVASRDRAKGEAFARENDIPLLHSSYEELLDDPSIDVVYIPLPNHLHVEWIEKAVRKGKHVLCEKPLALHLAEVDKLITLRDSSGLMIGEAYAMLHQPRLVRLKALLESGEIGSAESAHGTFYLDNRNPANIRNAYVEGGGGLWDIGVYPIAVGRWMFGQEPCAVACFAEKDPRFGVDHHATGILKFPSGGQMSFACGMRFPAETHMTFYTNTHRIEVGETYFSGTERQSIFETFEGKTKEARTYSFEPVDQYALECDNFALAVQEGRPYAGSLEHTLAQTKVLLALFESAASGTVVELQHARRMS